MFFLYRRLLRSWNVLWEPLPIVSVLPVTRSNRQRTDTRIPTTRSCTHLQGFRFLHVSSPKSSRAFTTPLLPLQIFSTPSLQIPSSKKQQRKEQSVDNVDIDTGKVFMNCYLSDVNWGKKKDLTGLTLFSPDCTLPIDLKKIDWFSLKRNVKDFLVPLPFIAWKKPL